MSNILSTQEYKNWLKKLKQKVRQAQIKASVKVNTAMLEFYWELGANIVDKQKQTSWGSGFLARLSKDLMIEFPDIKGFSKRNLEQIRRWYLYWNNDNSIAKQLASQMEKDNVSGKNISQNTVDSIAKQVVSQLSQIPWWHNIVIISKCKSKEESLFYINKTIENAWSRTILTHQIESGLFKREGKAITNFLIALPKLKTSFPTIEDMEAELNYDEE